MVVPTFIYAEIGINLLLYKLINTLYLLFRKLTVIEHKIKHKSRSEFKFRLNKTISV